MGNSKLHSHRVTLGERRRSNKKRSDMLRKGVDKGELQQVFNTYYKDQVKALYRAIFRNK